MLQLRVEVVGVVDDERLGRHRRLRRAPLRQPLMRDDHVLQPQQQFRIDRSAGGRFADDVAALQDVADQAAGRPCNRPRPAPTASSRSLPMSCSTAPATTTSLLSGGSRSLYSSAYLSARWQHVRVTLSTCSR